MDSIEVLRGLHRGVRFMFETSIRSVFTPEQMKERIDERGNSIVWLMWHTARTEDLVTQTILQGKPQLFESEGWGQRMGIDETLNGTGFGDEEVAEVTKAIDFASVDEYWQATAKASFGWLKSITPDDLDTVPDIDARLADAPPVLRGEANEGLWSLWRGRTAAFLFTGPIVSHGYMHVGEMQAIGGRLGQVGWF